MGDSWRFSVVIPVYNCEEYLEEAFESIVQQSIGFAENIQVVLVDDGSTDGTPGLCDTLKSRYPSNVVCLHQGNQGVTRARLSGLEKAEGRYINFMDADDKWSEDAFMEADNTFNRFPDAPFCAARHRFFGARSGKHMLDYKFKRDELFDLMVVWDKPQLSINNAFIRRECIKQEYFDATLKVSEDFLAISRILIENPKYAVMNKPTYWYRKRFQKDSALDTAQQDKRWYIYTLEHCNEAIFAEAKERYGYIPPFVQFAIMYDLQWRIKTPFEHPLDDGELADYKSRIIRLLRQIDDEIIARQHNIYREQKLYVFALKRGVPVEDIKRSLFIFNDEIWLNDNPRDLGTRCWGIVYEKTLHIDYVTRSDDYIVLEGRVSAILPKEQIEVFSRVSSPIVKEETEETQAEIFTRFDRFPNAMFDRSYNTVYGFRLFLPLGISTIFVKLDGRQYTPKLEYGNHARFWPGKLSYTPFGDLCLRYGKHNNTLIVGRADNQWYLKREILFEKSLAREAWARETFKYRRAAFKRKKRQIWLVSDRPTMAGDNGEALFEYIQAHPMADVEAYFVINENSSDYERMRKIGPTVAYNSVEHKKLEMQADFVISSAADEFVFGRSGNLDKVLRPLEKYRFVFLQHGITKDDVSRWLNKWNKNISMFVTAAQAEYDSIIGNPSYGYGPEQVKLTGFPRHDKLLQIDRGLPTEKRILIAPTWRSYIAGEMDPASGERAENPAFELSSYYSFYNRLINDQDLIAKAKQNGYSIDFLIHPAFAKEARKFTSDYVNVLLDYDYPHEFSRASIMVTDYSSVAFDFALLKKPVIYAQVDSKEFFQNHPWEHGYFEYLRDGFGPVCETYEDVVEALVSAIEHPVMEKEYLQRVESFYYEPPEGSSRCEQVINEIRNLPLPQWGFCSDGGHIGLPASPIK